jgi:DNA polymerase alpha subunit A
MSSSSARRDKLAELKAARAGGGRVKQWEVSSSPTAPNGLPSFNKSGSHASPSISQSESSSRNLYDEVDEEDYKLVVKGRLAQDDFIEDDDGGGYADDGREDWGEAGRDSDEEEDEEDEKEREKRKGEFRALYLRQMTRVVGRKEDGEEEEGGGQAGTSRPFALSG